MTIIVNLNRCINVARHLCMRTDVVGAEGEQCYVFLWFDVVVDTQNVKCLIASDNEGFADSHSLNCKSGIPMSRGWIDVCVQMI